MRIPAVWATVAVAMMVAVSPGLAATGTAVGVDPQADAVSAGAPRQLIVGSDVEIGETVVTGAEGKVELIFSDQTKLVIGPASSLLIEDYLLRNDGSPGQFAVNALQGSFRFMTGKSPKDSYQIRTATGTIGVRGTKFDFVVDPAKKETFLVLFEGALEACNLAGACVAIDDRCEIVSFGASDAIVLEGDKRAEWQGKFPFANFPSMLSPEFRVQGATACVKGAQADEGGSLADPSTGRGEPESRRQPPRQFRNGKAIETPRGQQL